MRITETLAQDGYAGPVRVLGRAECRDVADYLRRCVPEPSEWEKDRGARERYLYDVATRPEILGPVTAALGPDVILWGLAAVVREPGRVHPWHSDIESCGPDGGFVSVWIGIENTSRESSLRLLRGSHLLGRSLQEARAAASIARDDASPEVLLELAREQDGEVELVHPDLADGEALFFDGRLWHGSDNRRRGGARTALLIQFASADREVRMPDWSELDWPFRIRSEPLPPVVPVSGSASESPNLVLPPPTGSTTPAIRTAAHHFDLALAEDADEPWRPSYAFRGATPLLDDLSCHASVLDPGHSPHPPHAHREEEVLVPLQGECELVIAKSPDDPAPRLERLRPGSFVYYPSWQHHTIRNPGKSPVVYLMLKWRGLSAQQHDMLGTEIVQFDATRSPGDEPFRTQMVLEGPTECLTTLHAHVSVVEPGAGYEPHADAHDVAIVVLEGEIETLGRRVRALSAVYYGAGELHGLRNPGSVPARYLVFEFHAPRRKQRRASTPRRVAGRLKRVALRR